MCYNAVCSLPVKETIMKHPLCGKLQITHYFCAERPISRKTLTLYVVDTSKYKLCSNLCLYNNYCKVITTQNSHTTQVWNPLIKPKFAAHSKVFISKISVKYFPLTCNKYSIIKKKSQPFKTSRTRRFTLCNSNTTKNCILRFCTDQKKKSSES